MNFFNGKKVVLELGREIRFKEKQDLTNFLRNENAQISFILTASTDFVFVSNDVDSFKTRRAKQLAIPLVDVRFIDEYRKNKETADIKKFFITTAEDRENFSRTGTIPIVGTKLTFKPTKFDASKIKIWNSNDVELPNFDELTNGEIGKWAIFKETTDQSDVYFALELQIIPDEHFSSNSPNEFQFRFRYETFKGNKSTIQYAFHNDIYELQQLFSTYYSRLSSMPRTQRIRDFLPEKFGSKLLLRSLFFNRLDTQILDENVSQLIESLWIESIGDLNEILSVQPESISLKTIVEAEATLFEIKSKNETSAKAQQRFYELIPHHSLFVVDLIADRHALIEKIDLCQMLRDLSTVNELTNWNIKASIQAKYRALKCHIESLGKETEEFRTLTEKIDASTNSGEQVIVHHIYRIAKQTDALNFRSNLFNQKELFHGSKFRNFLGILSRGLLLPKIVSEDLGVTRTDFGCLGYGLYFSDSISTSLKYTTASSTRPGRRLLCVAQVALGESAKFYSYQPNLVEPPANFHSSHGVKRTNENQSKFNDNEFAVYHLDQQRLLYLIEVSWIPHDPIEGTRILPIQNDISIEQQIENQPEIPSTIEDEVIQVAEQDYGLICPSSGELVPLKSFHVRAQLVDVTAQVVLYQTYKNTNSTPIEAKYVFPLDENSSVCGFEAHINNKVIKGVVKEKEQAKREYREAIEKGHGAYLMHQEQAEVFSVSVGNLPADCEVIIKITYVAELTIENNEILFRLPSKVASWRSKEVFESKNETFLPSIGVENENSSMKSVEFSLKASIRMPYEIVKIFSPTHRLRRKLTDCLAMIEMVDNVFLDKDFLLSLTLKSVHLPRLLNETFALTDENNNFEEIDENSQAAMLTFYPKFDLPEETTSECVELILLVDVSNSMDGKHVQQAKQLAHLFLSTIQPEETNIYFNIVAFGSDDDECFPISSINSRENITKGKNFILHSLVHRGNTDLFAVLRRYSLLPPLSKFGRQFLLLSDGHLNDLSSILNLITKIKSFRNDRFFTCSIGDTANKHQLRQLANAANAGGLVTIFDSNYRSRWKSKVTNLLEQLRQPCLTNIQIEWHGTVVDDDEQELFSSQSPKIIRSLFNGMRLTVYRFIRNCHKATMTAMINGQEFVTNVFSSKMTESKGKILHCLTARSIIDDYENGLLHVDETQCELLKQKNKQNLIDLSIKYSVVSSFTSFVAIEERDGQPLKPGVNLLDVMLENDLDLLPYVGWDGDRSQRDLIKDKLINGKQELIGAGAMTKENLSKELENLCQTISYRAGGEAKFDLMFTLIETYRSQLKFEDKARDLEEQMQIDLLQEMSHATDEEKIILEKKLNELNLIVADESYSDEKSSDRSSTADEDQDIMAEYCCMRKSAIFQRESNENDDPSDMESFEEGDGTGAGGGEHPLLSFESGKPLELIRESLLQQSQEQCLMSIDVLSVPKKKMLGPTIEAFDDEDEEEADMGFNLFDDEPVTLPLSTRMMDKRSDEQARQIPTNTKTTLFMDSGSFDEDEDESENQIGKKRTSLSQCVQKEKKKEKMEQKKIKILPKVTVAEKNKPSYQERLPTADDELFDEKEEDSCRDTSMKFSFMPSLRSRALPSSNLTNSSLKRANVVTSDIIDDIGTECLPTMNSFSSPSAPLLSLTPMGFSMGVQQQQQQQQPTTDSCYTSASSYSAPPPPPFETTGGFSFGTSGMNPFAAASSNFSFGDHSITNAPSPTNNYPYYITPEVTTGTLFTSSVFPAAAAGSASSFSFGGFGSVPPSGSSSGASLFGSASTQPANVFNYSPVSPSYSSNVTPSSIPPPPPPPAPLMAGAFTFGAPSTTVSSTAPTLGFSFGPTSTTAPIVNPFGNAMSPSNLTDSSISSTSTPAAQPMLSAVKLNDRSQRTLFEACGPSSLFGSSIYDIAVPIRAPPVLPGRGSQLPPPQSFPPPPPPPRFPAAPSPRLPTTVTSSSGPTINVARSSSVQNQRAASGCMAPADAQNLPFVLPRMHSSLNMAQQDESDFYLRETIENLDDVRSVMLNNMDEILNRGSQLDSLQSKASELESMAFEFQNKAKTFSKKSKKALPIVDPDSIPKLMVQESYRVQDLLLLDVTPLSIGVEDLHGNTCVFIERNRTIPSRTDFYPIFTNGYAYQTTATIRIVEGEHKLAKYNHYLGEFILSDLSKNFSSQSLIISISMDIDANGILRVEAVESRSGSRASLTITSDSNRLSAKQIEEHIRFIELDPNCRAPKVQQRSENDQLVTLSGQTEHSSMNFSDRSNISNEFSFLLPKRKLLLVTSTIHQLIQLQLNDGSFEMNEKTAKLFLINENYFENLKQFFVQQGFNSFASNIREEILRVIVTGLFLMEMLQQIPSTERTNFLCPFDPDEIRTILHRHSPKVLIPIIDKAIRFYQEKRAQCNVYCGQLELNQSTWDKFIQKSIYGLEI